MLSFPKALRDRLQFCANVYITQKNYREDWDYDKQLVYYPVHITPEYEAHADVKKVQSDVSVLYIF